MLQPSENFTADQIRFLQNEAAEWIRHANQKIIEAANEGKSEASIDITGRNPLGNKYYYAPDALIEHFKSRGFGHIWNGQSSVIFTWTVKVEGELSK